MSRLFWCYEKAISFGFGNLAFSERQNVRNRVKIVFALRQSDFFRIWKIPFLCAPKYKKSRQGCFVAMKKKFLSDSEKSLFHSVIKQKITSRLLWRKEKANSFGLRKFTFWGRQTQTIAWSLFRRLEKLFVSDSKNSLKGQKKREIESKMFWLSVKAISFGFGKFSSSGLQR